MELARSLVREARRADERRVLVLAGDPERTRERAADALDAAEIPRVETTLLGADPWLDCEQHEQARAVELLGQTRTAVVLDCHAELRPNALGTAAGAVDGGGLLLVLTPPLESWPERRDAFDEKLAAPPFDGAEVAGHFRRRLVETMRAHRGVAIVTVCAEGDAVEQRGLTDPPPRRPDPPPSPPDGAAFGPETDAACLTTDQTRAVDAFGRLRESGGAVVVEADRGRGKSSAAGLAAANLALDGRDVLVTAPAYNNCTQVFARATALFERLGTEFERDRAENPQRLIATEAGGRVRYHAPESAVDLPEAPDVVLVDEAAALPVRRLERLLAAPAVAFTTTVHGYEGAGRGFSVRFRDRLEESDHDLTELTMTEPIRYARGDPVEVWAFRALLLDARPPVEPLVAEATPATATYRRLSADALLADRHLLREAFGLLVMAHYRTEPGDLARLLDAPNVAVRALTHEGHVVAVALLAREGGLDEETRERMYRGQRVRGNMIPDVLSTQLRDERAGVPVGHRILRIATHDAVRSRGLGSRLLGEIRAEFAAAVDWLGVGYGVTPELVAFWRANGYAIVHLSTTRNDTSGEYSAVMLDPCSPAGRRLVERHTGRFRDRIGAVLPDALDDCDPDVVRGCLRAVDGVPEPALSEWEWRLLAGIPGGASVLDTNPEPLARLSLRHLVAPADPDALTDREERLLVRKVLQARPWPAVSEALGFVSPRACKRTVGDIVETLLTEYAKPWVHEESDRLC